MIEQKYIDILSKQKELLLSQKRGLNFFQRIFFRKYTDWIVVTDEIEEWYTQHYLIDNWNNTKTPYGEKKYYNKQVELRMRLKDGKIERNTFRV